MAAPAEPILASALWTAHQSRTDRSDPQGGKRPSSGCASIDNTIGGTFRHGRICCVSAEAASGGRDLCIAYLASHILSSTSATATVIDTALSFDVRRLYKLLLVRLQGEAEAEQRALKALDRLKIMKVFDFEGLTDSISELRDTLEGVTSNPLKVDEEQAPPRGTIGDSEDEDEMLDSPSPPPTLQAPVLQPKSDGQPSPNSFLLIASISHVAGPMMKNRYAEGQALLMSFMRSLTHLTTRHHLLTLLLNDAQAKTSFKDESPSIFSTCKVRPALGRSFEHTLDAHLLVHRMPTKAVNYQQQDKGAGDGQLVSVVEVLQDRHGGSFGRCAAFTVDEAGDIKAYA